MTRAEGKKLKKGASESKVFAEFTKSEFAEGPSPATSKVDADRCYTYRVPGTEAEGKAEDFADGETVYDSWWICFSEKRLVYKEAPDGETSALG